MNCHDVPVVTSPAPYDAIWSPYVPDQYSAPASRCCSSRSIAALNCSSSADTGS